jgi:hypothetical protein
VNYGGKNIGNPLKTYLIKKRKLLLATKENIHCKSQTSKDADVTHQPDEADNSILYEEYFDDNSEDLGYVPNDDRKLMEIMLHAYRYEIAGRVIQDQAPYWVEKSAINLRDPLEAEEVLENTQLEDDQEAKIELLLNPAKKHLKIQPL